MERRNQGVRRCYTGGILSLSELISSNRQAIEYDLLTRTGHDLQDVGRSLSWGAFGSFIKNLTLDSALAYKMQPDVAEWMSTLKTNLILADIFDLLSVINSNICGLTDNKHRKKSKPYPRPGEKKNRGHIGDKKNAMPVSDLRKWFFGRSKDGK